MDFSPQWAGGTSPHSDLPLLTDCPSPLLELDRGRGRRRRRRSLCPRFVRLCSRRLLSPVLRGVRALFPPAGVETRRGLAPGPGE